MIETNPGGVVSGSGVMISSGGAVGIGISVGVAVGMPVTAGVDVSRSSACVTGKAKTFWWIMINPRMAAVRASDFLKVVNVDCYFR